MKWTIEDFVYKLYFDQPGLIMRRNKQDVIFKLIKLGGNVKDYALLVRGALRQPVHLYPKYVSKFWVQKEYGNFVIYVLYEE